MDNNDVIIIIPVHNEIMNSNELVSFQQCIKIMHKRVIKIIAPKGLNITHYINLCPENCNIEVIFFPLKFFYSPRKHGQLLLTKKFYQYFSGHSYLLIHHLDAYIFKDELDFWCSKNLDYIGAPWFQTYDNVLSNDFVGVGNGGFSLRKVSTILTLLHNWKRHLTLKKIIRSRYISTASKVKLLFSYALAAISNYQIPMNRIFMENEDVVLGLIFSKELKVISTVLPTEAFAFAFEMNPAYLFALNNHVLPFGCHGWDKYETDFWKNFIPFPVEEGIESQCRNSQSLKMEK
jgi:Protein of unknown function (DUF5672)